MSEVSRGLCSFVENVARAEEILKLDVLDLKQKLERVERGLKSMVELEETVGVSTQYLADCARDLLTYLSREEGKWKP